MADKSGGAAVLDFSKAQPLDDTRETLTTVQDPDRDATEIPPLPPRPSQAKPLLQRAREAYHKYVQEPLEKDIAYSDEEEKRLIGLSFGPEGKNISIPSRVGAHVASLGAATRNVLDTFALGLTDPKTAAAMVAGKISPAIAAAYFLDQSSKGVYKSASGGLNNPDNLRQFYLSLSGVAGAGAGAGEFERPGGARIGAKETPPADPTMQGKTAKIVTGIENAPQTAAELTRKGSKIAAGVGPQRTTAKLAEEYKAGTEEAEIKQREANEAAEAANREKVEKHATARRAALKKQEEQNAQHVSDVEEVRQRNEAATKAQGRRQQLANQINDESAQVGEQLVAERARVKTQVVDKKYSAVRERTSKDPGVAPQELADELKQIQEKYVKGSPESIRQVNDILRRAKEEAEAEEGSLTVNSREFNPHTDPVAWASFKAQGLVEDAEPPANLTFNDLQGYSSELGKQIKNFDFNRYGGDVYQALKHVKEAIDDYKYEIADRNGAGDLLRDADKTYFEYSQTFYDTPGATAETIKNVGNRLDAQHIAQPFLRGKTAARSIADIRRYNPGLADRIEALRKLNGEYLAIKPEQLKQTPAPEPPKPVEMPARPELEAPKQIEKPNVPTIEDVKARKTKELQQSLSEAQRFTRYDIATLGNTGLGTLLGFATGHPIVGAIAGFVSRKALAHAMNRPAVIEWLSRPEPEDIAIIKKLSPEGHDALAGAVKDVVDEARAHSQSVKLDPSVAKEFGFGKDYAESPKAASREGQNKPGANYTAAELKAFKEKNGIKDVSPNEPRVGGPNPRGPKEWDNEIEEIEREERQSSKPLGSKVSSSKEESPAAQPRGGAPQGAGTNVTLGQPTKSEVYPGAERYGIHSGGKQVGTIVIKKEGKTARVIWFGSDEFETGTGGESLSNKLGSSGVNQVLSRYAQLHPEVKTITGERIGGAGSKAVVAGEETGREVTIDLDRFRTGRKGLLDKGNNLAKGQSASED